MTVGSGDYSSGGAAFQPGTPTSGDRQEEIFVGLDGTATLLLGEPPRPVEVPRCAIAIVRAGTPVQLANLGASDATVLIVGAPPTTGDAEYLPDALSGGGARLVP